MREMEKEKWRRSGRKGRKYYGNSGRKEEEIEVRLNKEEYGRAKQKNTVSI